MFALWRSQKSVHKRKDPITGTHSLEIAVMVSRGDVTRVLHVIEGGVRLSAVKISRIIKIFLTISAFCT